MVSVYVSVYMSVYISVCMQSMFSVKVSRKTDITRGVVSPSSRVSTRL